jgi:hypothetical protein
MVWGEARQARENPEWSLFATQKPGGNRLKGSFVQRNRTEPVLPASVFGIEEQ